jgi:hypothetical protein
MAAFSRASGRLGTDLSANLAPHVERAFGELRWLW